MRYTSLVTGSHRARDTKSIVIHGSQSTIRGLSWRYTIRYLGMFEDMCGCEPLRMLLERSVSERAEKRMDVFAFP